MKTKQKPKKIRMDYDKKYDIFSMNWGKVHESMEICNGQIILDLNNKTEKVVGIEIMDIKQMIKEAGGKK